MSAKVQVTSGKGFSSLLNKVFQGGRVVLGERQRQIKATWKFKTVPVTLRYRNRENEYQRAVERAEKNPTRKNKRRVVTADRNRMAAAGCRIPITKGGWNAK